jgi:acetyl-CoA acetyltransferase
MNDGALTDTMIRDALWDAFGDVHMGITAETSPKNTDLPRQAG